jgi:uncharacterized Zn finger protein
MTELQRYFASNTDLEILPDNAQWKNRFEIKSETSNRIYVVAQRKSDNSFGCSCPGWKRHRNCKHLKTIAPLIQAAEESIKQKQIG